LTGLKLTRTGCYALDLSVALTLGDLGSVTVPLSAGSAGTVVLVIDPQITVRATTTWVDTNQPVNAVVTVLGTLTLPATLSTVLLWQPAQPLGCQVADWRTAQAVGRPTTVTTGGDDAYAVASVTAPKVGCYSLLVTLQLLANDQVTVAGPVGVNGSFVLAATPRMGPVPFPPGEHIDDSTRGWVGLGLWGLFTIGAFATSTVIAWRRRDDWR
jgi:hypothetical protein